MYIVSVSRILHTACVYSTVTHKLLSVFLMISCYGSVLPTWFVVSINTCVRVSKSAQLSVNCLHLAINTLHNHVTVQCMLNICTLVVYMLGEVQHTSIQPAQCPGQLCSEAELQTQLCLARSAGTGYLRQPWHQQSSSQASIQHTTAQTQPAC